MKGDKAMGKHERYEARRRERAETEINEEKVNVEEEITPIETVTEEDKVDGIPKPIKFFTVTAAYLNVRTEPKEGDNVMCVIKKDTTGIINFVSGEWTNITVSPINGVEVTGYVMSEFIKLLNEED